MTYPRRKSYLKDFKTTLTMAACLPAPPATNASATAARSRWSLPLVLYRTTPWFGEKIRRETTEISPKATKAAAVDKRTENQAQRLL